MRFLKLAAFSVVLILTVTALVHAATKPKGGKPGLVIQISDSDPGKWNQALNVAHNVQVELGADKVNIEVLAFGPGLDMLKFESAAGSSIESSAKEGVIFKACRKTMTVQKLTDDDMHPRTGYVISGGVEIIEKHREGWAYLKL